MSTATVTSIPDEYAACLVSPGALHHTAWFQLCDRLALLDVRIVAVTAARLSLRQVQAIYQLNSPKPHRGPRPRTAESNWLGYQSMLLEPVLPLVLRSDVPGVRLAKVIDAWKGPSPSQLRHPGDLRSVYPTAGRSFSVLHTPDDPDTMVAESRHVLIGDVLRQVVAGNERPVRPVDVFELRGYLPLGADPHPFDIVFRAILRGLLLLDLDVYLRPGPVVADLVEQVRQARRDMLDPPTDGLGAAYMRARERLAPTLVALPDPEPVGYAGLGPAPAAWRRLTKDRMELAAALRELADPFRCDSALAEYVLDTFDRNHLALDKWERHRLAAAIVFGAQA